MFDLLLGHILGDYFFQTDWMAQNKTKPSGNIACFIHCLIYSLCIVICLVNILHVNLILYAFMGIFLSHWFIDRYGLAYRFMKLKGGPDFNNPFAPIIYVMIDNTSHIILMYIYLHYVIKILI